MSRLIAYNLSYHSSLERSTVYGSGRMQSNIVSTHGDIIHFKDRFAVLAIG